jgi:hypothetical protein
MPKATRSGGSRGVTRLRRRQHNAAGFRTPLSLADFREPMNIGGDWR